MLFHPLKTGLLITLDPDNYILVIVSKCFLGMRASSYVREKTPLGRNNGADGKHFPALGETRKLFFFAIIFFKNLCSLRIG
jgi:hypothetical protein